VAVPRNLKSIGLTQNLGFSSKALIGIFSQTAGSACELWVNPVDFTVQVDEKVRRGAAGRGSNQHGKKWTAGPVQKKSRLGTRVVRDAQVRGPACMRLAQKHAVRY
jgi:hypothetical protein